MNRTFEDLITDGRLNIPAVQNENIDFKKFLFQKLEDYLHLLMELNEDSIKKINVRSSKINIIKNQTELVEGIKETIELYLQGKPSDSYVKLNSTLHKRLKKYSSLLNFETYKTESDFFRIRHKKDNYIFSKEQLFHIPFELRGKVNTQRFSIPGFPSLYMSNNIYTCWEELKRPNIYEFNALRLSNKSELKFLDLVPPKLDLKNLLTVENYKYLMTWPIIISCSIKVKNQDDNFKPEYILPQLLLQWIRNEESISGIKYWSTNTAVNPTKSSDKLYNYVLPVKTTKEKGICDELKEMFKASEPTSWQIEQINNHELQTNSLNQMNYLIEKIKTIEISKGKKANYYDSILGFLEYSLVKSKLFDYD
jgi:hypothetical protein